MYSLRIISLFSLHSSSVTQVKMIPEKHQHHQKGYVPGIAYRIGDLASTSVVSPPVLAATYNYDCGVHAREQRDGLASAAITTTSVPGVERNSPPLQQKQRKRLNSQDLNKLTERES